MKRLGFIALLLLSQAVLWAFPDPAIHGSRIALRRSDGAHAFPFATSFSTVYIWMWTNNSAQGTTIALPALNCNWPSLEFIDSDKLCIVDLSTNFVQGHVTTWNISNPASPTRVEDFAFSDQFMRWGDSGVMTNGATWFFNHNQNTANIVFDGLYRSPAGVWITNQFTYTPFNGEINAAYLGAVELGGVFNIATLRDSSACLPWIRLRINGGAFEEVSYNSHLIDAFPINGQEDPLAPDGENPPIHMRKDIANNRAIVSYPGDYQRQPICSTIYSIPVILSVDANVVTNAIQRPPFRSERLLPIIPFVRPDTIYYLVQDKNISNCEERGTAFGSVSGGFLRYIPGLTTQDPIATSEDGWIAFRNINTGQFQIINLFPNTATVTLHISNRP